MEKPRPPEEDEHILSNSLTFSSEVCSTLSEVWSKKKKKAKKKKKKKVHLIWPLHNVDQGGEVSNTILRGNKNRLTQGKCVR